MESSGPFKITGAAEIDRSVVRFVPWRWRDARERLLLLGGDALRDQRGLANAADQLGIGLKRVQEIAEALSKRPVEQAMGAWLNRVPRSSGRLDARVVGIVEDVFASHGDLVVKASNVVREIERRCAQAGLTSPSRLTIVRRLAKHRDELHSVDVASAECRPFEALAVDRVVPNVVIEGKDGGPTLPMIVVVTDMGSGTVLHAAPARDEEWPQQAIIGLADGLDAACTAGMWRLPASVHIERGPKVAEWSFLTQALMRSRVSSILSAVRTPATGRLHARYAGRSFAGVTVLAGPLLGRGGPEWRATAATRIPMKALDDTEAKRMIGAAIEIHNEKRLASIKRQLAGDRDSPGADEGDITTFGPAAGVRAQAPRVVARTLMALLSGWLQLQDPSSPLTEAEASAFAGSSVRLLIHGRSAW